ncbi:DUF192 domain-containing protein [Methanobrevibacter sp.]|uniref:DUF192 domain-containing protein n=1 Tax=Methanobrevibacter sp. TaxID=66852 RepID=UPI00386B4D80
MILNKTTNEQVNVKIVLADTFFKRFKGLMFKKDFNECMLFSNLNDSSIHSLFMRFTIDVYFIDENMIIYDNVTLKPWKFYKPKKHAKYILETKKNKLKLEIGDKLDFL